MRGSCAFVLALAMLSLHGCIYDTTLQDVRADKKKREELAKREKEGTNASPGNLRTSKPKNKGGFFGRLGN